MLRGPLTATDRGCVKTQNWIDFRGALTIPRTKQIDYRAFYEVVFIWHCPDFAFSHNLDPKATVERIGRSHSPLGQADRKLPLALLDAVSRPNGRCIALPETSGLSGFA